jgi:hypothetical protein
MVAIPLVDTPLQQAKLFLATTGVAFCRLPLPPSSNSLNQP